MLERTQLARDFHDLPMRDRVIVALDCNAAWEAVVLADSLVGKASWVKVGMTLYYAEGPAIVAMFKRRGFKVFLDLKFHDIPHQVEGAARSAAASGADMITMHTLGGRAMMEAGVRGSRAGAQDIDGLTPATLGITVLTSMNDASLAEIGVCRPVEEQVLAMANLASESGLSGVVASPQEAAALREQLGPDALIVTPGVRPVGSELGDQSRVATPLQAFQNGASHIVVGRPITQAPNPAEAFDRLVSELD